MTTSRCFAALTLLVAVAGVLAGCAPKTKPVTTAPPPPAAPATAPAGTASTAAQPPLTGIVSREAVQSFNAVWKELRGQDYNPDPADVAAIRSNVKDTEVFAVVATWCPDTRRDLPRFFKIADQARWSMKKVKLLAVDRTKKDPGGLTEKWKVTRVPTFIFTRRGQEIGRVVERPTTTLEKDIAAIVAKK